ncbi:MAG TPA: phosphatase PAP2 family protein [Stellaceae bacterium]|nr:phosphatase PAP2 family protein [Stellaceae bacterium]
MTEAVIVARRGPARLLLAVGSCAASTAAAFEFADRPLAIFAHRHLHGAAIFPALTHIPEVLAGLAALILIAFALSRARRRLWGPLGMVLLRCSVSLAAALMVKDELKYVFGRTWPETWVNNNPSFIGNGTFGFFPLHGGQGWASFPSGHTTTICAIAAVLWVHWPRFRWLYAAVTALVAIGLLGADYHWLSDIIAGGYLGAASGAVAASAGMGQAARR